MASMLEAGVALILDSLDEGGVASLHVRYGIDEKVRCECGCGMKS